MIHVGDARQPEVEDSVMALARRLCWGVVFALLACGCGRQETARLEEELARAKAMEAKHRQALLELEIRHHALEAKVAELTRLRRQAEHDRDNALAELEKLTEILTKIKQQRPDIHPGGDTARPEARQPEKPIRGKVTAVDKKLGLVVINAGTQNGVRKGYRFLVSRGKVHVGTVVVDEVFPDVSAAHYTRGRFNHPEIGDDVTTKPAADF